MCVCHVCVCYVSIYMVNLQFLLHLLQPGPEYLRKRRWQGTAPRAAASPTPPPRTRPATCSPDRSSPSRSLVSTPTHHNPTIERNRQVNRASANTYVKVSFGITSVSQPHFFRTKITTRFSSSQTTQYKSATSIA